MTRLWNLLSRMIYQNTKNIISDKFYIEYCKKSLDIQIHPTKSLSFVNVASLEIVYFFHDKSFFVHSPILRKVCLYTHCSYAPNLGPLYYFFLEGCYLFNESLDYFSTKISAWCFNENTYLQGTKILEFSKKKKKRKKNHTKKHWSIFLSENIFSHLLCVSLTFEIQTITIASHWAIIVYTFQVNNIITIISQNERGLNISKSREILSHLRKKYLSIFLSSLIGRMRNNNGKTGKRYFTN